MIGTRTFNVISACCISLLSSYSVAQCPDDGRFSTNKNQGTVTDKLTGLMWQQCPIGQYGPDCEVGEARKMTLEETQQQTELATTGDFTDWRLPTVKELSSLVDVRCYGPSIQANSFPNTPSHYFWTDVKFNDDARKSWVVNFYFGEDGVAFESLNLHGRLVRNTDNTVANF